MDLEQRLRASLVAPDPGAGFTAAVMAQVARGRWYQRNRVVLMSAVVAMGIAAAMLAWRLSDESQPPVVGEESVSQSLPVATTAAPVQQQATETPLLPPRTAEAKPQVELPATLPAAAAEQQASPRYTVVALLRHEAEEPEARAVAQAFFDLLMDELRKVPGLTLRVWEGEPPPPVPIGESGEMFTRTPAPLGEGEYGLTLVSLAAGPIRPGQGAPDPATNGRPWPMELRTGRPPPQQPAGAPRAAGEATVMASLIMTSNQDVAQQVRKSGEYLRTQVFPLDSAMRGQLIARMGDSGVREVERAAALRTLLSAASRTAPGSPMDPTTLAATAKLLADQPAARGMVASALRGHPHPALVTPLLESLDSRADETTRQITLVTLIADYSGDPEVRIALQAVADNDPSELLRALATYPVSGVDAWRSYVRKTLREGATPADKVKPLIFAANQTSGAFKMAAMEAMANDARIVEAVLALGRAAMAETDMRKKQPLQQALGVLTRPETGPVVAGTPRQEAQELYRELSRVQFGPRPAPETGSGASPR
jgi:hypothetical protein